MTPSIPLTPQQKRRRRNNIIFCCITAGISLGVLSYFFCIREVPPPASIAEELKAAEQKATVPQTPTEEGSEQATPNSTPQAGSNSAPLAQGALTTAHTAPAPQTSSTDDAAPTPAEDEAPTDDSGLSEEELAKLPPWQAEFVKLSRGDRLAFATAFIKAKEAYNAEQWTSCLALLNDCDLIYSGSPNVWNLRACALLATGGQAEAEACIKRSLELNPEDSVALMCQSELLMQRQDFQGSISVLQKLRRQHLAESDRALHDAFTFHQLLCHLMLRQEMEARALVAGLNPLCDTPLYYYAEAAFNLYKGDSNGALEPLRSAGNIFGNGGATSSYRKWLNQCGLTQKYLQQKRP